LSDSKDLSDDTATAQPPGLAWEPDLLGTLADAVAAAGLAGERRAIQILFLAITSRLLSRIVSVAVKGPSAGGKSHLVETVLQYFPESAYYALTAMSERALVYDREPLVHRMLVIYEAAGIAGDVASYFVRSLLSEGRVRYVTVTKGKGGAMEPLRIERAGPTGLIVTTTAVSLHAENETRVLSLTVTDSAEQTRAVLRAEANEGQIRPDFAAWHELQVWLEQQDNRVTIPFAIVLAELIPPVAIRQRRDFQQVLALIRAHAVLHQATRQRDDEGKIVATIDDYDAVRELVADLIADAADRSVSSTQRQTVGAVADMLGGGATEVTVTALSERLRLDKSTTSRRVSVAVGRGFLKNLEDKKGRPHRLVLGDPLPGDEAILPTAERLRGCITAGGVARAADGLGDPAQPVSPADAEDEDDLLDQLSSLRRRNWRPVPGGAYVER
jgi:hypothetical protein